MILIDGTNVLRVTNFSFRSSCPNSSEHAGEAADIAVAKAEGPRAGEQLSDSFDGRHVRSACNSGIEQVIDILGQQVDREERRRVVARFQTTRSLPVSTRRAAIREPIAPSPRKAIVNMWEGSIGSYFYRRTTTEWA
jgi:hypothetical protein